MCDSALDALRVQEAMHDRSLTDEEKSERVIGIAFADPASVLSRELTEAKGLVANVMWEAFGMDVTEGRIHASECDEAVFDFEQDAARIRASLLSYYGIDWDEAASEMTYADLCALLAQMAEADHQPTPGSLPSFRTSFAQALWYRTAKPPKGGKLSRELRNAFLATRSALKLGARKRDRVDATSDAMAEMFAAARRGA